MPQAGRQANKVIDLETALRSAVPTAGPDFGVVALADMLMILADESAIHFQQCSSLHIACPTNNLRMAPL